MSELTRAVQAEVSAFRPEQIPPLAGLSALARRRQARARRRTAAVTGVAVLVLAAAVAVPIALRGSSPDGPGTAASVTGLRLLRADVARSTATAPTDELVRGMNQLGYDLIKDQPPGTNTVLSPMSISVAFSLARAGARGSTAAQMDEVLHLPATDRDAAVNTLTRGLVTTDRAPTPRSPGATRDPRAEPEPPVVAVANGLFAQDGLPIEPAYLDTLAADYGAGVNTVDFTNPGALDTVNAWASEQTAGRVPKILRDLPESTKLVLANAVYLRATWASPLGSPEQTDNQSFTRQDASTVTVPMMHTETSARYAAGPGWQAVELPYASSTLAMWVLVPTEGSDPTALLSPETLDQVAGSLTDQRVLLNLPRFDFGSRRNLGDELQQRGLTAPFSGEADFSGITRDLFLSGATHAATITVDEQGTEAAAVTTVTAEIASAPAPAEVTVTADHPFAFAIVDTSTRAPLFIGTVADPTA